MAAARTPVRLALLLCLLGVAIAGFCALGTWQVHRRVWKLDLIARVDARVRAPPVAAPGPAAWPALSRATAEYRHVRASGVFDYDAETRVQAATELGSGDWLLTPLRTADGFSILVNRGFVPAEDVAAAARPAGPIVVTGLLRISEPGGGFLRNNDPAAGRWYSRDVAAIARAHGIADAAPYFIDAAAAPAPGGWPVGGLTVIAFPNNHLIYAITWYGLALLTAGMALHALRREAGGPRVGGQRVGTG